MIPQEIESLLNPSHVRLMRVFLQSKLVEGPVEHTDRLFQFPASGSQDQDIVHVSEVIHVQFSMR
jgi:hypothetical protein